MKLFSILAFLLLSAAVTQAQSYALASGAVTGGGGVSSGTGAAGSFSLTGTLAQQAWGAATGGAFSVSGGFLSQYYALQTAGAPPLTIRRNGGNLELVWGANVPGWVLQWNGGDLAPANWTDVAGAPVVNGAEQFHTFAVGSGPVFYRLRKL